MSPTRKWGGGASSIVIPAGASFADMAKLKGDKEIGDKINKIIGSLAEANRLKGVIDQADFNDESKLGRGKAMQDCLSKLVAIFENLDFRANRPDGDDLLGDAYEYLMLHFATESGKSKGQFYTPAEVSRVMAKVVGIGPNTRQDQTIYDPTCGSGSLLLKAADEAPRGMSLYGQEMDNATWALARMNLFLHGYPTAEVLHGNTLADPRFTNNFGGLRTFDFAVSNPPFSTKAWSSGLDPINDKYGRFMHGIPPDGNGDYAFLLHLITSLHSRGKGAIILPRGILFRGNREADIRKVLVQHGLIKGIIGLPENLFYGTGIAACILVIDKQDAHARAGIFMIDASREFLKDGNKNRLRERDIHKIVDVFNERIELPRYSRMVPLAEVSDTVNAFNLNISRYIDSSMPDDFHDLGAHMHGGIPDRDLDALENYWAVFSSLRQTLFSSHAQIGYSEVMVEASEVKTVIHKNVEFLGHERRVKDVFDDWYEQHKKRLEGIARGSRPKEIIEAMSEDLVRRYSVLPLTNPYDAYQVLMDYWNETMQDDLYSITSHGWIDSAKPRGIINDPERRIKETADLTLQRRKYKMDLIPPALISARYFAADQAQIEILQTKYETASRELEQFLEAHVGEGGLLEDNFNDNRMVTKSGIRKRLKAAKQEPELSERCTVLQHLLTLIETKERRNRAVKSAQLSLDKSVLDSYNLLTESDIKTIVIDDKWIRDIRINVLKRLENTTQSLVWRIKQLENRYAHRLVELEQDIQDYSSRVKKHLEKMGVDLKGASPRLTRVSSSTMLSSTLTTTDSRSESDSVPQGWSVIPLRECLSSAPRYGINAPAVAFDENLPTYLRITDIGDDNRFKVTERVSVRHPDAERYYLNEGDVVFARTGSVGKSYLYDPRDGDLVFAGYLICATPDVSRIAPRFLAYFAQSRSYFDWISAMSSRSVQPGINGQEFGGMPVLLPSLPEQDAIVEVLSDVDQLLNSLEKLGDKVREIKECMIQKLLTGRIRLVRGGSSVEGEEPS